MADHFRAFASPYARQPSPRGFDGGSPLGSPLPGLSSVLHQQRRQSADLGQQQPGTPAAYKPAYLPPRQLPPTEAETLPATARSPSPRGVKRSQPHRAAPSETAAAEAKTPSEAPSPSVNEAATTAAPRAAAAPPAKSSRYLREMDRRVILQRLQDGEKQAALAKEYQVSRAAICNLNKHRDEVLSRRDGNPLAKHPKKPRPRSLRARLGRSAWNAAMALREREREPDNGLLEIKSRAAALLLTTLRKKHASVGEFRRSSDRLMRLVLEEALAHVPVKTVEVFLASSATTDGVALEHPPCAVSMEPAGCPMLDLFHQMEPEQPTGYVSFGGELAVGAPAHSVQVRLDDAALPVRLNYHNVFLVDHVVSSAELVVAVVRRLQERGAVEAMISLVALIATQDALDKLHAALPAVKIVVAHVDRGDEELAGDAAAGPPGASTTDMILDRLEQVYHGFPSANAY